MSWHYQVRRRTDKGQQWYDLIEVHRKCGHTESITPGGETRAELIAELERMLKDARRYRTIIEEEQR